MRTAAATAAGMRSGRMPPRCFRRRFRLPQCMKNPLSVCPTEDTLLVFYTLHDRTIKRFPCIFFSFAGGHFPSTFFANFDGTFGLIIPDGFGDPISSFHDSDWQARPHTPYLTISQSFGGGSTTARRGPFAFASATHGHLGRWKEKHCFYNLFGHRLRARPRARPRPRPRPRPRRGGRGGLGLEVRVDVRRTEGRPPPSS